MTKRGLVVFESSLTLLVRLMIVFESSCQTSWSLGGFLFKHRSYSNQREHSCWYPFDWHTAELTRGLLDRIRIIAKPLLGTDFDHIRIRVIKKLSRSLGGFLFKHRSYSNQREHSCRYPLDRRNAKATGGYMIVFES